MKGLGVYTLGFTRDLAAVNQDDWYFFNRALAMNNLSEEEKERFTTAWGLLLLSAGRKHDVSEFSSWSASDIQTYLSEKGWTRQTMDNTVNSFYGTMTKPNHSENENQEYIDWDAIGLSGYHKAGKNYVPKDNYRALLHKGEMVLNAEQAKALKEYMGLGEYGYGGQSDIVPRPKGKIVNTWPWPMTAGYPSYPSGNQHRGLDFGVPVGTKVGAAVDGTIITAHTGDNYNTYASGKRIFGQYILMKGNNGVYYRYGHLSKIGVLNNQQVKAGQTIALSGNTGYSSGPHLHFQVQSGTANTSDINPYGYVTNGLFQTTGSITSVQGYNSTDGETANNDISSTAKSAPATRRFISGASTYNSTRGLGGAEDNAGRIVSSVDGGFNKLISYLDSISKRQDEQQILLETFSKSRASE